MKNKFVEVTILIVNYNTPELTLECVSSLKTTKKKQDAWEVLIIDNGSKDDSVKIINTYIQDNDLSDWIKIITVKENCGFAAGNNKGIAQAKGDIILLLNSDTEVYDHAIQICAGILKKHKKIGAVSCRLVLPNGDIDPACHRGFPTPWAAFTYFIGLERLFPESTLFGRYHQGYRNMLVSHEVDAISGAFFMIKKKVIEDVGLLDDSFFMYGEDLDWAYRIRRHGWSIWYEPTVTVLHKKKQSGRDNRDQSIKNQTKIYFYTTMKQFYEKHYKDTYSPLLTWLIQSLLQMRITVVKMWGI